MNCSNLHVRALAALGCATVVACSGKAGTQVTVTNLPVGSTQCPSGGVQIDSSGQAPQVICSGGNGTNGSNGFASLIKTTPIAIGDPTCPGGGVHIDSGLDNGAGGGIANNGILESGEILSKQDVCNGSTGQRISNLTPPSGPDGTASIKANGGSALAATANNASGGNAGNVGVSFNAGSNGGAIKVFRNGAADASFTFPAVPAGDFGPSPAVVSAGTVVVATQTTTTPTAVAAPAGSLFILVTATTTGGVTTTTQNDSVLYVASGDPAKPATAASGLQVAAGATLVFTPVSNGLARVDLTNLNTGLRGGSCTNAGTISVSAPAGTTPLGQLNLVCADYFGAAGSSLDFSGTAASPNAGSLSLSTGSFWNKGAVKATGFGGGNGGALQILSANDVFNTGSFTATGSAAASPTGTGGAGGNVQLNAGGEMFNSGAIDSSGGAGGAVGGRAAVIDLEAGGCCGDNPFGSMHNSGKLTAKGGDADPACTTGCVGGNSSGLMLAATDGSLTSTGDLVATGGKGGAGIGGSSTRLGRSRASIQIQVLANASARGQFEGSNRIVLPGSIALSGNVDASGGDGSGGGGGSGGVLITLDTNRQPNGQEIVLYGYRTISAVGGTGAGTAVGGNGGYISFTNSPNTLNNLLVPGGAVVNYADLDVSGGASGAAGQTGGPAGFITLSTQSSRFFPGIQFEIASNAGKLTANAGALGGASGGTIYLYGRNGVTNNGVAKAVGDGTGPGGWVAVRSEGGPAVSAAAVDVSGGANGGSAQLGNTAAFGVYGVPATLSGPVVAAGGAADPASGTGGGGGLVTVDSMQGFSNVTVPAPAGISVKGGAAKTAGPAGTVVIDGRLVTQAWTH